MVRHLNENETVVTSVHWDRSSLMAAQHKAVHFQQEVLKRNQMVVGVDVDGVVEWL